jgi:hypothetical protein
LSGKQREVLWAIVERVRAEMPQRKVVSWPGSLAGSPSSSASAADALNAAAALKAGFRNKNDRNDARGIADLMPGQQVPASLGQIAEAAATWRLLTVRAALRSQLVALKNTIRSLPRQEGIG